MRRAARRARAGAQCVRDLFARREREGIDDRMAEGSSERRHRLQPQPPESEKPRGPARYALYRRSHVDVPRRHGAASP